MPILQCECGSTTNTCVSRWIVDGKPRAVAQGCFARIEDGKWSKGCAYAQVPTDRKPDVDQLIEAKVGHCSV